MADQAGTPAMLMTRPSRWWLGTICWHRLPVVNVEEDVQAGDGRSHPQRRPVPAGRGQHDRQQPVDEQGAEGGGKPDEVETCRLYRFRMPQAGYAIADSG
jgi:hypothetical protein